ncbi:unnamed protein product [Cuscuta europaea]|uniref:Uncharacterized protein n=1 Tax=Cuscuta europaea TaxID=41803 RepID=A0A9P1EPT1_CUSEU|nr:unnamed protein product [Cuscuta europaea]
MARIGTALLGGCLPWSAGIGGGVHRQPPPRPRVQAQPLKAAAAIIPKVKSIRCSRVSPPGVTKEEEEAMLSPRQFSFFGVDMVDKDALAYTKLKPKGFLVAGGHLMITDLSDCIETLLENEDRWIHTCYSVTYQTLHSYNPSTSVLKRNTQPQDSEKLLIGCLTSRMVLL